MIIERLTPTGRTISDDPARWDMSRCFRWISEDSYWGGGQPRSVFEKACAGSMVIGVYDDAEGQVAMARVVTDGATFAWLCDVFVDSSQRGAGVGKDLMGYIMAHPNLQNLRRFNLTTLDAHSLYAQFGFQPLKGVERWMEIRGKPYR